MHNEHPFASCFGSIIGYIVGIAISSGIIYGVWNYLLPVFIHVPALTFWQCAIAALGLVYIRKFFRYIIRG